MIVAVWIYAMLTCAVIKSSTLTVQQRVASFGDSWKRLTEVNIRRNIHGVTKTGIYVKN